MTSFWCHLLTVVLLVEPSLSCGTVPDKITARTGLCEGEVLTVQGIDCGSAVSDSMSSAPAVQYTQADSNKFYVLVMVDPDAPSASEPEMADWLHWLVTDIIGEDLVSGDLLTNTQSQARELVAYSGPTPPPGSGPHRYQFFLTEITEGADITEYNPNSRAKFNLEKFYNKNRPCPSDTLATFQFQYQR